MSSLYRKYRPQRFDEVVDQNHIKITLQNEIERGEISHAYLFYGARGLGKTTIARLFAKSVNCLDRKEGESEPCNKCKSCLDILASRAIDIVEMDAATHTQVEKIRENVIENIRFSPSRSKYKVFIIDEVHMLSTSSFNALLKTLEEPPSYAIFILCTTEIHKIPETIISRCQRFDFKKVGIDDMLSLLFKIVGQENKQVDESVLKNIVLHSEGCVRDAISLLAKILTLGDKITAEQAELVLPKTDFVSVALFIDYLLSNNITASIELINKLVEDGVDLSVFSEDALEFMRKLLLIKAGNSLEEYGMELDEQTATQAQKLAEKISYDSLLKMMEIIDQRRKQIKISIVPQLPLELASVEICDKKQTSDNMEHLNDNNKDNKGDDDGLIDDNAGSQNIDQSSDKNSMPVKADISDDINPKNEKISTNGEISLESIKENWDKITDELLNHNYTLSALMKISEPLKWKQGRLLIGVRNNFYRQRLEEGNNIELVEQVISDIAGVAVKVDCQVSDKLKPLDLAPSATSIGASVGEKPAESAETIKMEKPTDAVQDAMNML